MIRVLQHLAVYKFLIELCLFCIPFGLYLPRRTHFCWRMVLSLAACAALSSIWSREMAAILPLSIARYILLFLSVCGAIWCCLDISVWTALYCGAGGYAAQHLFFRLTEFSYNQLGVQADWAQVIIYVALFALIFTAEWQMFTLKMRQGYTHFMENRRNPVICVIVILCTVVLSSIGNVYSAGATFAMQTVCAVYDCICCCFSLWELYRMFQMDRLKQDQDLVRQLWELEKRQMTMSKETIDLINIKCHDMRHTLRRLERRNTMDGDQELQEMAQLINIYDTQLDTGHDTLNLVLMEKSLLCQSASIRLNCIADGKQLDFMEEADVYSLFGNLLDNAIHAAQSLNDEGRRVITLTISEAVGLITINEENYYQGSLRFEDHLPVTTQVDSTAHGYGMKSMRYLVEKYHGEMNVQADEGIFEVNMVIPLPA